MIAMERHATSPAHPDGYHIAKVDRIVRNCLRLALEMGTRASLTNAGICANPASQHCSARPCHQSSHSTYVIGGW
jgi:hypothetical protein